MSIRLEPTPASVGMARIFVSSVLTVAGVSDRIVQDALIFVSDVATVLVGEQKPIDLDATLVDGSVSVEGNSPDMIPEAGAALLGDSLVVADGRWTLTATGS